MKAMQLKSSGVTLRLGLLRPLLVETDSMGAALGHTDQRGR